MLAFLRKKPLISDADALWVLDVYRWLLTYGGGYRLFEENTELVLPTPDFFPVSGEPGPKLAQDLFEEVRGYAGMQKWPCTLVEHDEPAAVTKIVPNQGSYGSPDSAAGTFSVTTDPGETPRVEISYAPDLTEDPMNFVATMAHELGHYVMLGMPEPPPGGWDEHEYATDICSAFLGFGVFACNSAFKFEQFQSATSIGWNAEHQGYLSEEMLSFSLGVFIRLANEDEAPVFRHLKSNPRSYLKRALKEIDRRWAEEILEMQEIEGVEPSAPSQ